MSERKLSPLYLYREDLERALKHCDLGDSFPVSVVIYPHKDSLPELVQVIYADEHEALAAEREVALLERMRDYVDDRHLGDFDLEIEDAKKKAGGR